MTERDGLSGNERVTPYAGVVLGVCAMSSAAILIRMAQADAHSLVIAAWRLILATAVLALPAFLTRRRELIALTRADWLTLLASGALLAIHFGTWITSLSYTSVAASVVLVSTNPIFVALASHLLLHEHLSRGIVVGMALAFIGSVVIIGAGDMNHSSHHRLLGDVLALIGGVTAAGYVLLGRRMRARLSLLAYVFPVYGTAAVLLLASTLVAGLDPLPQQPRTWSWLWLIALGPQLLGHSSINWALRYLSAAYVTIAVLAEPVGSILLAWWLLNEPPVGLTLIGGPLILIGIALATWSERPGAQAHRRHATDTSHQR
ncbi:MAG: DMT family transporter [Chloroflexi bacterium]|nr:DMT family transporter [Chloroflexota bacterium]